MSFWEKLKKDVEEASKNADEVGIEKELAKLFRKAIAPAIKKDNNFVIRNIMVKKLQEIDKAIEGGFMERTGQEFFFPGRWRKFLEKHDASNGVHAAYILAQSVSIKYNLRPTTNRGLWANSYVLYLKYVEENVRELEDLKDLEERAKALGANRVVEEAQKICTVLINEEKQVRDKLLELDVDNYALSFFSLGKKPKEQFFKDITDMERCLEDKIVRYSRGVVLAADGRVSKVGNRSELLQEYKRCLDALVGDSGRVERVIRHLDKRLAQLAEKRSSLGDKKDSALTLRTEVDGTDLNMKHIRPAFERG